MRIALAQMNSYLGDFPKNSQKILTMVQQAVEESCELIVFPELAFMGYHPCDLLERPSVIDEQQKHLQELLKLLPSKIACLVGAVSLNPQRGKPFLNTAYLIQNGVLQKRFHKELLPVYDVFDDSRHFAPGDILSNHFELNGKKIQVLICEDMWGWDDLHARNPIIELNKSDVDLVVNLSASPFTLEKRNQRLKHARMTVECLEAPLVYVNMVGSQDELIYDGGSFAVDLQGKVLSQSYHFEEDLNIVDFDTKRGTVRTFPNNDIDHLHGALVSGIKDFLTKTGFQKAHIGSSGGIDSAVVACLLKEAIGSENLTTIALPSDFNESKSLTLAKSLATNLGCRFFELPISSTYHEVVKSYESCFGEKEFSLIHENIQARLRGTFLMAFSNDHNSMLITTGNKSEYATGYATLYGDMCGGLAPIADLLKEQVYELAQFINKNKEIIPQGIIMRPPSAELRPNQKDSDSLPDYEVLDASVNKLVSLKLPAENKVDQWVLKRLYSSEFKRWQSPPILKISEHGFGQGRRMPIAHKAYY